jgi:hypothetical protein
LGDFHQVLGHFSSSFGPFFIKFWSHFQIVSGHVAWLWPLRPPGVNDGCDSNDDVCDEDDTWRLLLIIVWDL